MPRAGFGANYWKLWTASVVSNLGDGVSSVAYPWLASAVTRNPVHIALVTVATRLPWLLFTLPAGVITDLVDRRRLVGWMDLARGSVTLGVAVVVLLGSGQLSPPPAIAAGTASPPPAQGMFLALLYGGALLLGMAEVLRDNAAQTLMPALVSKDQLERANGNLWGAEMVTNSFVGPPLGGFLIAASFSLPFFVDSASFVIAGLGVLAISGHFRPQGAPTSSSRPRWRSQIAEGVGWLWRHPLLRPMAVILGVMNGMGAAAMATYVLFVQEVLGLRAAAFGALLTAGAVGGVVGSVTAARVSRHIGPGASLFTTLLGSVAAYAVTALTSSPLVVWVAFVAFSFLAVLWNVITVSLRQAIIPDHLLGRVNSVYRLLAWGMIPLGSLLGGVMVALAQPWVGREWALRAPFLLAAAAHVVLFLAALPTLNTRRINEARQAAEQV